MKRNMIFLVLCIVVGMSLHGSSPCGRGSLGRGRGNRVFLRPAQQLRHAGDNWNMSFECSKVPVECVSGSEDALRVGDNFWGVQQQQLQQQQGQQLPLQMKQQMIAPQAQSVSAPAAASAGPNKSEQPVDPRRMGIIFRAPAGNVQQQVPQWAQSRPTGFMPQQVLPWQQLPPLAPQSRPVAQAAAFQPQASLSIQSEEQWTIDEVLKACPNIERNAKIDAILAEARQNTVLRNSLLNLVRDMRKSFLQAQQDLHTAQQRMHGDDDSEA